MVTFRELFYSVQKRSQKYWEACEQVLVILEGRQAFMWFTGSGFSKSMTTISINICCRKNTRTQRSFLRKTINYHGLNMLCKNYTQKLWFIFWRSNLQPSDLTGLNSFSKICLLLDSSSIKSFWFSVWVGLALFSSTSWNKIWSWAELWPMSFPTFWTFGDRYFTVLNAAVAFLQQPSKL